MLFSVAVLRVFLYAKQHSMKFNAFCRILNSIFDPTSKKVGRCREPDTLHLRMRGPKFVGLCSAEQSEHF